MIEENRKETNQPYPFVSILLAVRNEEKVIADCLKSLVEQDYPVSSYEILVGNDASTDGTQTITEAFSDKFNPIKVYSIDDTLNGLKGKANALAQLAKIAKGDIFLFTDADMSHPKNWISSMFGLMHKDVSVLNGYTVPKYNDGLLSMFQAIDWLFAQKQLAFLEKIKIPITAMGNNFMVPKAAYQNVGGYETIGFSITEDFKLFRAIVSKGGVFRNAYNLTEPSYTLPENRFSDLLSQRIRWMQGALSLPKVLLLPMILNALTLPLVTGLFLAFPLYAIIYFLVRWTLVTVGVVLICVETNHKRLLQGAIFYDFYNLCSLFLLLLIYPFKKSIHWKGREFEKK